MLTTIKEDYYGDDFVLKKEHGLNFAAGFTPYDSSTEPMLDPSFGELVF